MYFPSLTPSSLVHEDQSVEEPTDHQLVIAKLTTGLGYSFIVKKVYILNHCRKQCSMMLKRVLFLTYH